MIFNRCVWPVQVTDLQLHLLAKAQLDAVLRLDAICFENEPFAAVWWQKALTTAGASSWIMSWQGQPVAYCLFSEMLDEAELLRIAVDPQQRGKGLAAALLHKAQGALVERGITRFFLEVRASNCAAQALYHRCGWQPCGRRKNYYPLGDAREDALLFSWQP